MIKTFRRFPILGCLILLALGCNFPMIIATSETPTSSIPTFEPSPIPTDTQAMPSLGVTGAEETQASQLSQTAELTQVASQEETPQASPTIAQLEREDEAILILEPGPGSRLTSPVHITGEADSVFEQTLGVRIIQDDGTILAVGPVFIEAELGQRGTFSVDVPIEIGEESQAVVQVFEASPRDGDITHLASVGVILADSGPEQISLNEPHGEQIRIDLPEIGSKVRGGMVHVEGYAVASFEQHLLVEVLDMDGNVLGSLPATVQSQEMGVPGTFSVDVPYQISSAGPGRIVVRDPSPAFEVDLHVASVEVNLEP